MNEHIDLHRKIKDRAEAAERKLAIAVEALKDIQTKANRPDPIDSVIWHKASAALAALEKNDSSSAPEKE